MAFHDVLQWEVAEVSAWLQANNFASAIDAFVENEVNGEALTKLDGPTLQQELGVESLPVRQRILAAIQSLTDATTQTPPPATSTEPPTKKP